MPRIRLVVTDLDNTLYSWVDYVVYAIDAMVRSLVETTGFGHDEILDSLRQVYAVRGSIEYPFVIQEAALFRDRVADFEQFAEEVLYPARQAFAAERRERLRPFEGVVETLRELRRRGIPVVGLSDASSFGATLRLRLLGLDGYLAALYAIEPYPLPPPERLERRILDKLEAGLYRPETLRVVNLPVEAVKPSPRGYESICREFGVEPQETLMVGDNLAKDMGVAEAVGAHGLWAEYGTRMPPEVRARLERYVPQAVLQRNAPELEGGAARPNIGLQAYAELLAHGALEAGGSPA
jgi:FMN phosphatase YigB (HAD superfamily)